jgi:hypothetical protein
MMFVVIEAVNVVVSILVVFFLPAKPQSASFLPSEERSFVLDRLAVNQAGIEGEKTMQSLTKYSRPSKMLSSGFCA